MSDQTEQHRILPSERIFHIEKLSQSKISLLNKKSHVHTKQMLIPIDSDDEQQEKTILTYNHQPAITLQSVEPPNQITFAAPVIRVQPPLSPPRSQLIPDSIINDKQTTKRISDEKNATHLRQPSNIISFTPKSYIENKTLKFIRDNQSSSVNQVRYYPVGSILTSTNAFLLHRNSIVAHETRSDGFLSDTIFIILIVTLTIIILLFCLGLFCLCRRSTKRHISPSFDSSSYVRLNGHSYEMPFNDHPQQKQDNYIYENNIPLKENQPLPLIPVKMVDNSPPTEMNILHQTIKQKLPINNRKLKKKRAGGCCCCHSKAASPVTINARTRL